MYHHARLLKLFQVNNILVLRIKMSHLVDNKSSFCICFYSQTQPQVQVQDEEITEDDLRLIHERESSIRQLEVSLTATPHCCSVL